MMAGALIWGLATVDWRGSPVHSGGVSAAQDFFAALFPPDLSPGFLGLSLRACWQTVAYAVASISLAVLIGLPLGMVASGAMASSNRWRLAMVAGTRMFLAGVRSVHELVWAVLFVAAFGLSSLTAILAIAIPYAGILGRVYSELLNDVSSEPLRALRSSGASPLRALLYGRLPMALPDMLSYTFYRFECAIRAAAIMSFVGIQGLGYQIQLSLNDLLFNQVWTLMLFLIAVVLLVDLWSTRVRRSLVS